MKENLVKSTDDIYLEDKSPWGETPDRLIINSLRYLVGNTVLDLGCGDGRNTEFLVQSGFKVVAIDSSQRAIERLDARMSNFENEYFSLVEDLRSYNFSQPVDNIVCNLMMHCLEPCEAEDLMRRTADVVSVSGAFVIKHFTDKGDLMEVAQGGYWPKEDEVIDFFRTKDFTILYEGAFFGKTLYQDELEEENTHQIKEMILRKN